MAITIQNRTNNSTESQNSRYVQGGMTDRYKTRLGWWEKQEIAPATDDILITIQAREVGRPDLIANRLYQKAELAWLVLQFNNIIDPVVELTVNKQLTMPSPSRVMLNILTHTTGGKEIKV